MTPPDSGEYLRARTIRNVENPMKPDSGEREALLVPQEEVRAFHSHTVCIGWETIRRLAKEGAVYFAEHDVALVAADDLFGGGGGAVLSPDLAQRILAALETELANAQDEGVASYWHALASELRAAVERKT